MLNNKTMGRKCYVQYCNTNATPTTTDDRKYLRRPCFAFPLDEYMRKEWFRRIPRDKESNWKNAGVCILHFESRFIKKKNRHILSKDAIPTIFGSSVDVFRDFDLCNQQNRYKTDVTETVTEIPVAEVLVAEVLLAEAPVAEIPVAEIINFDYLRSHFTQKLKLHNWLVTTSGENVYIFKLNKQSNGNLSVQKTINICSDLTVKVFHNNVAVDGIIPNDLRISQWLQLQSVIDKLNIDESENDLWHTLGNRIVAENHLNGGVEIKQEKLDSSDPYFAEEGRSAEEVNHSFQVLQEHLTAIKVEDQNSYPHIDGYYFDVKHVVEEENPANKQQDIFNQRHICSKCGKEFDQYARLMIHMKRHDPSECQTCQICNKSVYGNIDRHMRSHDEKNNVCEICGTIYKSRKSLQAHWYSVHSEGEFYCDICNDGKNFKTKSRIRRHMDRHIDEALLRKPPRDIENFQLEWLQAQQNQIEKQLHRNEVDEDIKLETSAPIDRLRYICEKCGREFGRNQQLVIHMRRRHDESRFKVCPICKKSFPDGLSRHMNSHFKVKNHVCDICGSAYTQASSLKLHKEINHSTSKEYSCDICKNERKYLSKYHLRKHLQTHVLGIHRQANSTHKTFTCYQCDKTFARASYLRKHLPRHKGLANKRKACHICSKRYVNVVDLRYHLKKIHGIDRKTGEICN